MISKLSPGFAKYGFAKFPRALVRVSPDFDFLYHFITSTKEAAGYLIEPAIVCTSSYLQWPTFSLDVPEYLIGPEGMGVASPYLGTSWDEYQWPKEQLGAVHGVYEQEIEPWFKEWGDPENLVRFFSFLENGETSADKYKALGEKKHPCTANKMALAHLYGAMGGYERAMQWARQVSNEPWSPRMLEDLEKGEFAKTKATLELIQTVDERLRRE